MAARDLAMKGIVVFSMMLALGVPAARADEAARVDELERKVQALVEEMERLRVGEAPQRGEGLASRLGFGPAASKVYGAASGVSIGG